MNKIEEMFQTQIEFCTKLFKEKYNLNFLNLSNSERLKWSKEYVLSIMVEAGELLNELKWKTHRYESKQENIDNLLEEAIDITKFLLNIVILSNYNSKDFIKKFFEKSEIVDIRYEQEKLLEKVKITKDKYVVLDIDGVLNDYPGYWLSWYNSRIQETHTDILSCKKDDLILYNKYKDIFRKTGEERNAHLNEKVISFIEKIYSQNLKIILLSSRPYKQYFRLFFDTVDWLKKYKINYDFIFFAKNKEDYLIENFNTQQIHCVIDDEIENVNKLSDYFDTYLLSNYLLYSKSDLNKVKSNVRIIDSFNQIKL